MITAKQFAKSEIYKNLPDENNDPYADSPFYRVKIQSSKRKGSVFEKITKDFLKNKLGLTITKPTSTDHDTVANGVKIEIKGSSGWVDNDGNITHFRWQQIRPSQDYDAIIFLAMYPDGIKFYYASKKDIIKNVAKNQHGGGKVDSGTRFVDGFPEDHSWMKEIVDASFIDKL